LSYLLVAILFLIAVTLAMVLVLAWRQRRLDATLARQAADDSSSVTTDRVIKLVESVATVIRALEERTRELEASIKELGAERSGQDERVAVVASSVEQVRADQIADGKLAAEMAERLVALDRAVASAIEQLGNYQDTLVNDFLPNVSRRDERLVAIDANLTAAAERLAKLAESTGNNARETAVLSECFQSLERSISELTIGFVELRRSHRETDERPTDAAANRAPSAPSDKGAESDRSTMRAPVAPSDETSSTDQPNRRPTDL
jgi:uncharacterized protein HemX